MTEKSIYEFEDYKPYLKHIEQIRSHIQRGFRSRLAEEVGCQNAFVSQVLNTGAHFSLEQALKISKFLRLAEEETKYFLWIVEHARAATRELKAHFKNLLNESREKNLNISTRVRAEVALTSEDQSTYYSQWYFSAIHVLVTIPKFQNLQMIGEALGLSKVVVEKAVLFLVSCGLVIEKNGKLLPGPAQLHLEKNSPNIPKHHSNWRLEAIRSLQDQKSGDVHYSTVSSLSVEDMQTLQAKFVQDIQDYVEKVKHSREETLCCFNLDFFKLAD